MASKMEGLCAPITSDTILEVRSGTMKPMKGLSILSGIDKTVCLGPVPVTVTGIVSDEHDPTFHGGPDKAIHGYCSAHYASWRLEFPAAAARFRPGGFGENLVFGRFNERNVHIGDVFAVGSSGLLLQVSLPRQPCFKLNHRFGLKNFAPNTWKTSRTGWYYRVLHEGMLQAGDEVRLVERRHPEWPLERVQEFLHRNPGDVAMTAELAAIDDFGDECKNQLRSRAAKQRAQQLRQVRGAAEEVQPWRPFRVVEKRRETPRIVAFVLECGYDGGDGGEGDGDDADNTLAPGSHVKLRLGNGLVRTYSVIGGDRRRFELGVALADNSRGGSRYLHETVDRGSIVEVGRFGEGVVPLGGAASHHVLVAGGVGITAFLTAMDRMRANGYSLDLHYAVRSQADVAFGARLVQLATDTDTVCVKVYAADDEADRRLDVDTIIQTLPWNAHVCFCGPPRMMAEAREAVQLAGLGASEVHFEGFGTDTQADDPFSVVVANRDDAQLAVAADETLLAVLQQRFGHEAVPSSCEVGNCATCRVVVREGQILHRGAALTDEERRAGDVMLACVSRGVGRLVVDI